ncbi:MAG: hypothetical protein IT226_02280 [Flavobacteriales bacterium]|nr:hypothetical protein [Flavobacteriales bacterium]
MKTPSTLIVIAQALCAFALQAQVRVDRPVELVGSSGTQRQVLGLAPASDPGDALDAATEQGGGHRFATTVTGIQWNVQLPGLSGEPSAGTELNVRTPTIAPGDVSVTVNGFGPYAVEISPGVPLLGDQLTEGTMASLVFEGNHFQLLNGPTHVRRTCPAGMVAVGDQFCIEQTEREMTDFFTAAVNCAMDNRRLCTWGEWAAACTRRVELDLYTMVGNWEWTNSSANEDQSVRVVGYLSCTTGGTRLATDAVFAVSRCCYSR